MCPCVQDPKLASPQVDPAVQWHGAKYLPTNQRVSLRHYDFRGTARGTELLVATAPEKAQLLRGEGKHATRDTPMLFCTAAPSARAT